MVILPNWGSHPVLAFRHILWNGVNIPFQRIWRRARDSNPRSLSTQRFSRPPLSTTQPALQIISNCYGMPVLSFATVSSGGSRRATKYVLYLAFIRPAHCVRCSELLPAIQSTTQPALQIIFCITPASLRLGGRILLHSARVSMNTNRLFILLLANTYFKC